MGEGHRDPVVMDHFGAVMALMGHQSTVAASCAPLSSTHVPVRCAIGYPSSRMATGIDAIAATIGALDVIDPGALKAVAACLKAVSEYGSRNDTAVAAEFREQMDEITVDLATSVDEARGEMTGLLDHVARMVDLLESIVIREDKWKEAPEHMRPLPEDLVSRLLQWHRASSRAGSHQKRRMLWNAFFRSFDPGFFAEGMSNHLWRIAEQLEYPECEFLARVRIGKDGRPRLFPIHIHSGDSVKDGSLDDFCFQRLVELGVASTPVRNVGIMGSGTMQTYRYITEIGEKLLEFVWDEGLETDRIHHAYGSPKPS